MKPMRKSQRKEKAKERVLLSEVIKLKKMELGIGNNVGCHTKALKSTYWI